MTQHLANQHSKTQIVDTVEQLTPAWFTNVLHAGGTLANECTVSAAHTEVIGTGQVGMVVRATLTQDDHVAPTRLIVKLPSGDAGSRQTAAAMGFYEAEVNFYLEIAPRLGRGVPKMHWGAVANAGTRFTLVLDDLSVSAQVGDMVAGCTIAQARLAINQLPQLQAPVWADPDLPHRAWLDPVRTDAIMAAVAPRLDMFLQRFSARLTDEHVKLVERMAPNAQRYRQRCWEPPFVIGHCDYRLDNMLFGHTPEALPISVVDWQGARLAPPLLDPAVFLGACLDTDSRREHQHALLHSYHDGLLAQGVEGFSFADCLESYRRCAPWAFLGAIAVSVSVHQTDRGDEMWARMVRGCADLVLDTGATDLLD